MDFNEIEGFDGKPSWWEEALIAALFVALIAIIGEATRTTDTFVEWVGSLIAYIK